MKKEASMIHAKTERTPEKFQQNTVTFRMELEYLKRGRDRPLGCQFAPGLLIFSDTGAVSSTLTPQGTWRLPWFQAWPKF